MVSVLVSSVIDPGFFVCFSESENWLSQNQDIVYQRSNIYSRTVVLCDLALYKSN
jgi:hypothetical protein